MKHLSYFFVVSFAISLAAPAYALVVKEEPAAGHLPAGHTVLVDDGSCPKGQIKEVTAGNNISDGRALTGHTRTRKCIPKTSTK